MIYYRGRFPFLFIFFFFVFQLLRDADVTSEKCHDGHSWNFIRSTKGAEKARHASNNVRRALPRIFRGRDLYANNIGELHCTRARIHCCIWAASEKVCHRILGSPSARRCYREKHPHFVQYIGLISSDGIKYLIIQVSSNFVCMLSNSLRLFQKKKQYF